MIIQLKKKWILGDRLTADAAGFGRVYEATGEGGEIAVVKLVEKLPGAERELLFGDLEGMQGAPNIVPIWDSGEHEDDLALVMPKADGSLRSHLVSAGGPLELDEAVEILQDIAQALVGIFDVAVHRDLKPENILRLNGSWCLADFGIARYAEAATDPETRKASFTRQYGAPEQWKYEHATPAADIYAFGVIAYELLTGRRPFNGPDYRHQHLHEVPASLNVGTPRLRVLVEECLIKAPEARPTAHLVAEKLKSALSAPSRSGAAALAELNRQEVRAKATERALQQGAATEANRRNALGTAAESTFRSIHEQLRSVVEEEAPTAQITTDEGRGAMAWVATLGRGRLGVARVSKFVEKPWDGPFDVIAMSQVTVNCEAGTPGYRGRSHSLWFCDAQEIGRYAWFEIAFMASAFVAQPPVVPTALDPEEAGMAFSGITGTTQVAWGPRQLDRDDLDDFVDRWIGWFAAAGSGSLTMPSQLPEPGRLSHWRQPVAVR